MQSPNLLSRTALREPLRWIAVGTLVLAALLIFGMEQAIVAALVPRNEYRAVSLLANDAADYSPWKGGPIVPPVAQRAVELIATDRATATAAANDNLTITPTPIIVGSVPTAELISVPASIRAPTPTFGIIASFETPVPTQRQTARPTTASIAAVETTPTVSSIGLSPQPTSTSQGRPSDTPEVIASNPTRTPLPTRITNPDQPTNTPTSTIESLPTRTLAPTTEVQPTRTPTNEPAPTRTPVIPTEPPAQRPTNTAVPPTPVPPTPVPPTPVPPTPVPPTNTPEPPPPPTRTPTPLPTATNTPVPPTAVPPTAVPPTAVPPTEIPPTRTPTPLPTTTPVPPTAVPPTRTLTPLPTDTPTPLPTDTPTPLPTTSIEVAKSANPIVGSEGATVTFRISVKNISSGPIAITITNIRDKPPTKFTFGTCSPLLGGSCVAPAFSGARLVWSGAVTLNQNETKDILVFDGTITGSTVGSDVCNQDIAVDWTFNAGTNTGTDTQTPAACFRVQ